MRIITWTFITALAFVTWACGGNQDATADSAGTVAESTEAAASFEVDPAASEVAWVGKKHIGDQHNGTIAVKGGTLSVEQGQLTAGNFSLDVANGLTVLDIEDPEYNGKLIGHLKSDDFFSAADHPEVTFDITKVEPLSANGNVTHQIAGNLTIKGITHEISFPAKVRIDGNTITAEAEASFDRTRWDVKFHSGLEAWGDKTILDEVPLTIKLVANAAKDGVAAAN